jgi:hypothetical protein
MSQQVHGYRRFCFDPSECANRNVEASTQVFGNATNQELAAARFWQCFPLSLQEQSEQHCGTWLPDKEEPQIIVPVLENCVWDNGNSPQNAAAEGPQRDHCERFQSDTP